MQLRLNDEQRAEKRESAGGQLDPTERLTEKNDRKQGDRDRKRVQQQRVGRGGDEMQGAEVAARRADIAGTAHDDETEQAAPWWKTLANHDRRQPEQYGRQRETIAEQLRSGEPETVGELAEDPQRAEADGGSDHKCDARHVSILRGRGHA